MKIGKFKSAYNLLIIHPIGLQCKTSVLEIMSWESSEVRFDHGPLPQGQKRIAKFQSGYNSLIIGPKGLCQANL